MIFEIDQDLLQRTFSALGELPCRVARKLLNDWENPLFAKALPPLDIPSSEQE